MVNQFTNNTDTGALHHNTLVRPKKIQDFFTYSFLIKNELHCIL